MSKTIAAQLAAIDAFRGLHHSGCFVLPNPWDVGTAGAGVAPAWATIALGGAIAPL